MELRVNGRKFRVDAEPARMLLGVLRDELELTGAKYGCGEGQCGACTVLLDGLAVRSCITPLRSVEGKEITTIEGLSAGETLTPLQQAFLDADALQCGYCTPGMILAGTSLLKKVPNPTPEQISASLKGNLCRCGTYPRIVAAVRMAAARGGRNG